MTKEEILAGIRKLVFGDQAQELKFETYKLEDGTEITAATLEVGAEVKIGEALATAGEHKLEDGRILVVGENGLIVEVKEAPVADPAPSDPNPVDPLSQPTQMDADIAALKESFNAHVQAFGEYKTATDGHIQGFKETITKQDSVIQQLLSLVEKIVEVPAGDPPADPKRVNAFSKVETKNSKLNKFAKAAQELAQQA